MPSRMATTSSSTMPILKPNGSVFTFPRQTHTEERRCITDYFASVDSLQMDVVAFQLVTIGSAITKVMQQVMIEGNEGRHLHLRGMAIETAEALEEYAHRQIRLELDIAAEDSPYVLDLFHGSYQGARFSVWRCCLSGLNSTCRSMAAA